MPASTSVFPSYVDTYIVSPTSALEAVKPHGKTTLIIFLYGGVWFSAGGNAGPVPSGNIIDGTGSFFISGEMNLTDRTFDVTDQPSVSMYNTWTIPIQVGLWWQ